MSTFITFLNLIAIAVIGFHFFVVFMFALDSLLYTKSHTYKSQTDLDNIVKGKGMGKVSWARVLGPPTPALLWLYASHTTGHFLP